MSTLKTRLSKLENGILDSQYPYPLNVAFRSMKKGTITESEFEFLRTHKHFGTDVFYLKPDEEYTPDEVEYRRIFQKIDLIPILNFSLTTEPET